MDAATADIAAQVSVELLRAALEPSIPPDRVARRIAMRGQIRRYVRDHLRDPLLDPRSIAHAHSVSVRTLYALFEETGESIAALVRQERLARCYADLERPAGGGVSEIAVRWGFRDSGHFSRTFKREFGATPREVRQAAVASRTPPADAQRIGRRRAVIRG